jgi:hypothetical protein
MSFVDQNGKRLKRTTETSDYKTALLRRAKTIVDIKEGKWFDTDSAQNYTFGQLMDRYLSSHSKINKTAETYQ